MRTQYRQSVLVFGTGLVLGIHPGSADAQGTAKPIAAPATPTIAGITVGGPMSAVDAKCKESGVTCVRRTRKAGAVTLDRVRMNLATGEHSRVVVIGKGGTVLSAKGRYRVVDPERIKKQRVAVGPGTIRRGQVAWGAASGVVTAMDGRGVAITFIDTKAATAKGWALTTQPFLTEVSRTNAMVPLAPATSVSPLRLGSGLRGQTVGIEQTPTPMVTQTNRIPVKLTLGKLACLDENDATSIVYGDDPYLNIVGVHTTPNRTDPFFVQKTFSNVEENEVRDVNTVVFKDDDARRFVRNGEAVGVQVTLFEGDLGNDDELDFAYPIVDYAYALANQNKTLEQGAKLAGDGGSYYLTWKLEIGAAQADQTAYASTPRYRSADPKLYAGSFAGGIGSGPAEASLTFVASRDPAFPNGVLQGQIKDGGVSANVRTLRLLGDSIELFVAYPSGSAGQLVGYLVGDGTDRRLVGTLVRDGVSRGVSMVKK